MKEIRDGVSKDSLRASRFAARYLHTRALSVGASVLRGTQVTLMSSRQKRPRNDAANGFFFLQFYRSFPDQHQIIARIPGEGSPEGCLSHAMGKAADR
jgi:hypothetical protein